jgi:hypothetical protein
MRNDWLLSGVLAVACASLVLPAYAGKVRVEVPRGTDLSKYKTYQWLPPKMLGKSGVVEDDPAIGPLVKEAVNRELTQKGLTEVATGGDLQVSTIVLAASVPQLEAVLFAGPDLMYDTPIASMGRYNREGTLVVNLIDPKTKKSAWTGMVTESIDNKPGGGQKKIAPAAAKMFKKFPAVK